MRETKRALSGRVLGVVGCVVAALVVVVMSAPQQAQANDSAFGGTGAELVPLQETRIKMASEDIRQTYAPEAKGGKAMAWHVHATYRFANPTDKAVTLQLGFPEHQCDAEQSECLDDFKGRFRGLKTTVRGAPVKHRVGKVSKKHAWAPQLGRVFLFSVTFKPREVVEVVHTYRYSGTVDVDGASASYITRTGGLWNGPIGHARFTVTRPGRAWRVVHPPEFKLASFTERPLGKRGQGVTEIVFEMRDWTPKGDLNVYFASGTYHELAPGVCPSIARVDQTLAGYGGDRPQREREAEAAELFKDMTADQLRVCRNLPFALHGMAFKDPKLAAHFYGKPSKSPYDEQAVIGFRPNPHYAPSLLTEADRRYVRLVKALEADAASKTR